MYKQVKKSSPPRAPHPSKAGSFVMTRSKPIRKSSSPLLPKEATLKPNEEQVRVEQRGEYLVYKELEEAVGEFTPNPGLWLATPHDMLGGQSPLQLAFSSPEGKSIVIDMIQMIRAGSFT